MSKATWQVNVALGYFDTPEEATKFRDEMMDVVWAMKSAYDLYGFWSVEEIEDEEEG